MADSMSHDEGGAGGGGFLFYKHFYVFFASNIVFEMRMSVMVY
jgi:hypothetical protein